MRVVFHKGPKENSLSCYREDGSATRAEVGPALPAHDLTHLIVESALGLNGGFFALVRSGRTLQELSDPAVIPTLDAEAHLAEVLARGLGSLVTGACRPDQLAEMLRAELGPQHEEVLAKLTPDAVSQMLGAFGEHLENWKRLSVGESLVVDFPIASLSRSA